MVRDLLYVHALVNFTRIYDNVNNLINPPNHLTKYAEICSKNDRDVNLKGMVDRIDDGICKQISKIGRHNKVLLSPQIRQIFDASQI
jgi:hypothetical protein